MNAIGAITARHRGRCALCAGRIHPGDPIAPVIRGGWRWQCEHCAEQRGDIERVDTYRRESVGAEV